MIADGVPEIARRKSLPARTLFGARGDRVTKGRYSKRNATIYYATPPGGIDRLFRILGDDSSENRRLRSPGRVQ
jgi:hypothetical protein